VFGTGFVTYANEAKQSLLAVSHQVLEESGAVSEAVVRQMVLGALDQSGADIGVAVSGIAGPDGGTEDKPVGTVWLAWGTREDLRAHCAQIPGSRTLFQQLVAAVALDLIRRHLLGLPALPHYFTRQAQ
jgi:nicotinamide-nucleotide amidase